MAFEVKFELSEIDVEHFRNVMRKAQLSTKALSEKVILANAKNISTSITHQVPQFVGLRIKKLDTFVAMIEDSEWQLPQKERINLLSALSYFSEPEYLFPAHIPALGFLDDAIMIDLVADEFSEDIDAFNEFCIYRNGKEGVNVTITRDERLNSKRQELHTRIKNHRAARQMNSSSISANVPKNMECGVAFDKADLALTGAKNRNLNILTEEELIALFADNSITL